MGFKECNLCRKPTGLVPPRFCVHFHVVCDECVVSLQKQPSTSRRLWRCPCKAGDRVCNAFVYTEADLKTPNYVSLILQNWQFSCTYEVYGCAYMGTGEKVLNHEMHCKRRHRRICPVGVDDEGNPCDNDELVTHLHLMHHLVEIHQSPTHSGSPLLLTLEFDEESDAGDGKWRQIQCSLVSDGKQSYYLMLVAEDRTHLRIWLTEIELEQDDGPQSVSKKPPRYVMWIPAPLPNVAHTNVKYEFTCNILPFGTHKFSDDEDDNVDRIVELEKKFLRRISEDRTDGKVKFQVLVKFLQKPVEGTGDTTPIPISPPTATGSNDNSTPPSGCLTCKNVPVAVANVDETQKKNLNVDAATFKPAKEVVQRAARKLPKDPKAQKQSSPPKSVSFAEMTEVVYQGSAPPQEGCPSKSGGVRDSQPKAPLDSKTGEAHPSANNQKSGGGGGSPRPSQGELATQVGPAAALSPPVAPLAARSLVPDPHQMSKEEKLAYRKGFYESQFKR